MADPSRAARQAEHALGDDVLEHLGGAALDRVAARAQELVAPVGAGGQGLRADDVDGELGQALVGVRPQPLDERALGPGLPVAFGVRQPLPGQQPQRLRADVQLGERVGDHAAVLEQAALGGERDRVVEQLAQPDLQCEAEPGALVHERRKRHLPAVADAADDVRVGDPGVLDEQLVELGLARDLAQRAHLRRVLLHVHEEVGQALVLGRPRCRCARRACTTWSTARRWSTPSGR